MNIKSILATKGSPVVTTGPENTIREALSTLTKNNFGALVVVNDEKHPIGIISERDIVRLAAKNENFYGLKVKDVMTQNVITGIPQDELRAVANIMTEKRFRHLPIVDDSGVLIGIVSIGDIVKAERNHFEGEADTLRAHILAS